MKRLLSSLSAFILCALTLSSCSKDSGGPGHFERPLPVTVADVVAKDVPVYIEAIGNVEAYQTVNIRPRVGGAVMDVSINGGDTVKVGDLLYKIDPTPFKVIVEKAEANLLKNQAELEYGKKKLDRYSGLVQKDYVAQINIEEYQKDVRCQEAQIRIDKAELEDAQTNLDYCQVVTPIDGKVSLAKVDIGNIVQANDPNALISILQVKPIYVNFSLTQKDFQELQEVLNQGKRTFKVILPFESKKEFDGELDAFDNRVSAETATIQLKGTVKNEDELLWPGEFVKVRLFVKTKNQVPVVPLEAIQRGQKGTFVFSLNPDQTVEVVSIKVGETFDDFAVVDEGLKPGMKVITDGQLNLRPGAKVMVTNPPAEPAKASQQESKPVAVKTDENKPVTEVKSDKKADETKDKI